MQTNTKTWKVEKRDARFRVTIQVEYCKGCGICTAFCPKELLVLGGGLNSHGYPVMQITEPTACQGCLRCVLMCPDAAFTIYRVENEGVNLDAGTVESGLNEG